MAKIYTKAGDLGLTSLYDTKGVSKTDYIFEVLGNIDELNSHIGLLITNYINEFTDDNGKFKKKDADNIHFLRKIQNILLDIGSDLSTNTRRDKLKEINNEDIKLVEQEIDGINKNLKPLKVFILPGGYSVADSQSHVCRTVCRRAERSAWKIHDSELVKTKMESFKYLNRLSDYFFTLGRYLSEDNEIVRGAF